MISYEYLSWWSKPTEHYIIRLCFCCTFFTDFLSFMYHKKKKPSHFLSLTVNISSQGLISPLNSIGFPQGLKGSLYSAQWLGFYLIQKEKQKLVEIRLVYVRCHLLSLVITLYMTHYHSFYHSFSSLSIVLICFHSLSIVVT